jgi:hypothetical protein
MKEITSKLELNQYYKIVSDKLDLLMSTYKILPSEILFYIKNNLSEVKEEFGLVDVKGIDRIILDVATHFHHTQLDKIMSFESFTKKF